MRAIKCDLSSEIREIKIELFFDLHIGSRKCRYDLIQERIDKVKNSANTYCIIGGDLIHNSTRASVGDTYSEELSPMEQLNTCVRLFEPIKDKIICITAGNHERRTYKTDGVDLIQIFADELNLSDKYSYSACLVFLRFGKQNAHQNFKKVCYSIFVTHGDGQGGKTIGGKANGLQKRGQIVNADIVITGHTHAPLSFRDSFYQVDYQNSCAVKKDQLFVNASATLDYEEYAEIIGMKPSSTQSPVVVLSGKQKFMNTIV